MKYSILLLLPFITSFLVVPSFVHGAGLEEDVLDENPGTLHQSASNTTKYYCTYRNLWTKERHPVNYPEAMAHWAGPIMWTHTTQFEPFRYGSPVTRGIARVAEEGFTDILIQEMEQEGSQVFRWSEYPDGTFFTSQKNFVHIPPIEANANVPYLSMVAGMGPSPDWFTGFYTFWLTDEYTRTWYDHIQIQTKPWDAGTDAGTTYDSVNSDLYPPLILSRIDPRNAPAGGELMDSRGYVPNVGELECYLIVGDEPLILPDCDWFADPCCNETTKECGAQLPYGRDPMISDEYLQVLKAEEEAEPQDSPTILILETAPYTEPTNLSAGGNGDGISSSLGIAIGVIGALVFSF